MIVFDLGEGWLSYLAHSPQRNLIFAAERDAECKVLLRGRDTSRPADFDDVEAIVCDCPVDKQWPDVPTFFTNDDVHRFTEPQATRSLGILTKHDAVLCPYVFVELPGHLFDIRGGLLDKLIYFPHSAPGEEVEIKETSRAGVFGVKPPSAATYPFLGYAYEVIDSIQWDRHPGYKNSDQFDAFRNNWFERLSQRVAGIVGLGWSYSGYVLAKYYEFLRAGMLLLCERIPDEERGMLGFRDGHNCLEFQLPRDVTRLRNIVQDIVGGSMVYDGIVEAGKQLVNTRHTGDCRIAYLKRIVGAYRDGGMPCPETQRELFCNV